KRIVSALPKPVANGVTFPFWSTRLTDDVLFTYSINLSGATGPQPLPGLISSPNGLFKPDVTKGVAAVQLESTFEIRLADDSDTNNMVECRDPPGPNTSPSGPLSPLTQVLTTPVESILTTAPLASVAQR